MHDPGPTTHSKAISSIPLFHCGTKPTNIKKWSIPGICLEAPSFSKIWCARCRKTFVDEATNVLQPCHKAWSDTIHASMTHRSQIMKCAKFRSVEYQATLRTKFVTVWCTNEILYTGNFSRLKWKLTPPPLFVCYQLLVSSMQEPN